MTLRRWRSIVVGRRSFAIFARGNGSIAVGRSIAVVVASNGARERWRRSSDLWRRRSSVPNGWDCRCRRGALWRLIPVTDTWRLEKFNQVLPATFMWRLSNADFAGLPSDAARFAARFGFAAALTFCFGTWAPQLAATAAPLLAAAATALLATVLPLAASICGGAPPRTFPFFRAGLLCIPITGEFCWKTCCQNPFLFLFAKVIHIDWLS